MYGEDLAERLRFDYQILHDMRCPTFDFEAYRTPWDFENRRNPIASSGDTAAALKYRFILRVPTLISATEWAHVTEIGVDVSVNDYPEQEPNTFVLSEHVPWSPHFKRGAPVCIGEEFWVGRGGHVVLGELVIHLQRMLNWDERGRGPGYVGWNEDAINYHRTVLDGRPLNQSVIYAKLPEWLVGEKEGKPTFDVQVWDRRAPGLGFEVME